MDCFNCKFGDCINDDSYNISELKEFDRFVDDAICHDNRKNETAADRYNHSQKGVECRKRYLKSEKGKIAQKKYAQSERAKELRKISNDRNRESIRRSKREWYWRNKKSAVVQ